MPAHRGGGSRYAQVAGVIRDAIIAGQYRAGSQIPSVPQLVRIHSISKTTAERAVALLAEEGVVERRVGVGTFVTGTHEPEIVHVRPGTRITARMARGSEGPATPPGVPVLVVEPPDGPAALYAADRAVIIVTGAQKDG